LLSGRLRSFLALGLVLVAAGCGGANGSGSSSAEGARLFNEAGCAGCHSLTAAAAMARIGPDLDALKPTFEQVSTQVREGGSGMPSFAGDLTDAQIATIASFVSESASGQGISASASTAAQFKPDKTKLADCSGNFTCLEQAFGNLAYDQGPKPALAVFDKRIAADPEIERNCHRIAHMMGAASLLHFDGAVGMAFSAGSAICASGYYHGVLERAFSDVSPEELGAVARALCADPDVRALAYVAYQCVHGLGHGLMIYTGYDLPRSLRICDGLATARDQTSCTGGVFMENISSSYGITSKWVRDDDPLYPCPVVAERHKLYCYLMVTSRILPLMNWDFAKTADWCRKSERQWVAMCFQSFGRDASGTTRGNIPRILEICGFARGFERSASSARPATW
jgi:cytochrome c553